MDGQLDFDTYLKERMYDAEHKLKYSEEILTKVGLEMKQFLQADFWTPFDRERCHNLIADIDSYFNDEWLCYNWYIGTGFNSFCIRYWIFGCLVAQ